MKIAICDDDICIGAQIEKYIKYFENEIMEKIYVDVFLSGEDFVKSLEENPFYDIVFLDIEMKTLNGIQVGTILREQMSNEIIQIIYISSKENYAIQLFKLRPLDFIVKPFTYDIIAKVLNKANRIAKTNINAFCYSKGQIEYKILIQDIMYFQSSGRKIIMITNNDTDIFYDTIANITKKLPYFICIHKSYLINYNYIKKIEYNQIEMINNNILPISQVNRQQVRQKLFELKHENLKGIS